MTKFDQLLQEAIEEDERGETTELTDEDFDLTSEEFCE